MGSEVGAGRRGGKELQWGCKINEKKMLFKQMKKRIPHAIHSFKKIIFCFL